MRVLTAQIDGVTVDLSGQVSGRGVLDLQVVDRCIPVLTGQGSAVLTGHHFGQGWSGRDSLQDRGRPGQRR